MRPQQQLRNTRTTSTGKDSSAQDRSSRQLLRTVLPILALLFMMCPRAQSQDARTVSRLGAPQFPMLEFVNLNEELGLEAPGLRGFGLRVDEARRRADAETVAAMAVVLSYYEELAATQAETVTAIGLLDEASRIADEQQNADAVRAIGVASQRIAGTEAIALRLNESLSMLARTRGDGDFIGYVRIINEYDRVLDVYIDGQYVGFLFGGESSVYSTGNGSTQVRVTDAFGNTAVEMLSVRAEETVSWTLKP